MTREIPDNNPVKDMELLRDIVQRFLPNKEVHNLFERTATPYYHKLAIKVHSHNYIKPALN